MRIAIIGAGAIGCFFGSRLQASGHEVTLVHHNMSVVARIRRNGVLVREHSGTSKQKIEIKQSLSKRDDPDFIIVAVKAFDTDAAARLQLKAAGLNTTVLTMQNGLGNVEAIRRHLPPHTVIAGSTTEAVTGLAPGVVNHTGSGTTWIGELNGTPTRRCSVLQMILAQSGLKAAISQNILGVLWLKAVVNSAINPISALTRTNNVELLEVPYLQNACIKVVREGTKIARANGILLPSPPESMLRRVLASTSSNRSSMLQDIEAGRQTEIRQLNGVLSKTGRKHGLMAPYNQLLMSLVLGLETARSFT